MKIPKYIRDIIKEIENHGYEVFVVGGACRDYLMGKIPKDYDIATSAKPHETKEIFKGYNILDYGEKHGTISVFVSKKEVQITTFRLDKEYMDNRHPKEVEFIGDLKEDLKRRDFTMNAIAYNKFFIDYFSGAEDIKEKTIRCVGDPDLRFKEDALRIMRALRFSCNLNFKIDKATELGIFKNYKLLNNISKDRVKDEIKKMITKGDFFLVTYKYFDLFKYLFSFVENEDQINLKNNALVYSQKILGLKTDLITRISIFLILFIYPQELTSERIESLRNDLTKLSFSKIEIKTIVDLVYNFNLDISNNEIGLKKSLNLHGFQLIKNILEIKLFLALDKSDKALYTNILKHVLKIKRKNICYKVEDLAINGNDLKKIGITNKNIKIANDLILEKIITNKLKNKRRSIIEYLEKNKDSIL